MECRLWDVGCRAWGVERGVGLWVASPACFTRGSRPCRGDAGEDTYLPGVGSRASVYRFGFTVWR